MMMMDDDEEEDDGIEVWGVHYGDDYDSTYTSSGYDTNYDGDASNPNDPPGGDGADEDEVISTAQINRRAAEIAAGISLVHNSDGTTTYTLEGVEFTNESEWLEAILEALLDSFADDPATTGWFSSIFNFALGIFTNVFVAPGAQAAFNALSPAAQRGFLYDTFGITLPE